MYANYNGQKLLTIKNLLKYIYIFIILILKMADLIYGLLVLNIFTMTNIQNQRTPLNIINYNDPLLLLSIIIN